MPRFFIGGFSMLFSVSFTALLIVAWMGGGSGGNLKVKRLFWGGKGFAFEDLAFSSSFSVAICSSLKFVSAMCAISFSSSIPAMTTEWAPKWASSGSARYFR